MIDVRLFLSGVNSGVEEYTRNLLTRMFQIDEKNRYQLFLNGWRMVNLPRPWRRYPVVNWSIPNKLLDLSFRFLSYPKVDRLVPADLYFSPHFNLLRFTKKARRIITIHDLSFARFPIFFSARKRLWHAIQDIRHQVEDARHIIAVSEATKRDLVHYWEVPEGKVTVIHSGVGARYHRLPPRDLGLLRFRVVNNLVKPFILYVGTVEPRKNLIGAIQAFNILKRDPVHRDLEFVIAGRFGWLYEEVLRAVRESSYRSSIRLWGPADPQDILMLYNAAEVFVYPSFFEGFGFPTLEAQACGVPVVAAKEGSLPEILGSSALLVDPLRQAEIADALHRLLTTESEAARLRVAGFENVARFSWERTARETLACFDKVRG